MRLTVRRARLADAAAMCAVHVASIKGLCSKAYSASQICVWAGGRKAERYREPIEGGKEDVFVAEAGKRLAGFASLGGSKVYVLYVHPAFAGKGVGRALMRRMEGLARRRNVARLTLESTLNAVPFYERAGFRPSRRAVHVMRLGPRKARISCVCMSKAL